MQAHVVAGPRQRRSLQGHASRARCRAMPAALVAGPCQSRWLQGHVVAGPRGSRALCRSCRLRTVPPTARDECNSSRACCGPTRYVVRPGHSDRSDAARPPKRAGGLATGRVAHSLPADRGTRLARANCGPRTRSTRVACTRRGLSEARGWVVSLGLPCGGISAGDEIAVLIIYWIGSIFLNRRRIVWFERNARGMNGLRRQTAITRRKYETKGRTDSHGCRNDSGGFATRSGSKHHPL